MKAIFILTVSSLALGGCATTTNERKSELFLYKAGSTVYSKQKDQDACKIASFRSIPQAIGQQTYGGSYSPGRTYCSNYNGYISCTTSGADYTPPKIQNFDINQRLRNQFINNCMSSKGYKTYDMPYCDDGTGYVNSEPAPALSKITCLNRQKTLILRD